LEYHLLNKHREGGTVSECNDMTIFNQNLNTPKQESIQEVKQEININVEQEEQNALNWNDVFEALQGTRVGKTFIPGDKKKAVDIASDIITRDYSFKTMFDTEELWFYDEGYYKTIGEAIIKDIVQKQVVLKESLNSQFVSEIIESVKRKTYIEREDFEAPLNLICLNNGIYDLNEKKLIDHNPRYYFKNKIEVNYNPNAVCPKIEAFIDTTLEKQYKSLGYEIAGFCLYRHYFIQRAIMLTGTGQNGKSVYLDLLTKLLGCRNIASETIQNLCHTNFGTAQLYGKLANICGDLPSVLLQDSGEFKKLTSGMEGDSISAQNKFQNKFNFMNAAKLLFAANEVPESKDQTDAFFRRWIIIDFPYKFVSGLSEEEYTGFVKKANKTLINELTIESELEGFLLQAIKALERLLEQRDFTNAPSVKEIKLRYNLKSNSALVFCESYVTDEVEEESGKEEPYVIKEFLLKEYKDFCKVKGITEKSETGFFKSLKERWSPESIKKLIELGVRKNVYVGIKYLSSWRESQ